MSILSDATIRALCTGQSFWSGDWVPINGRPSDGLGVTHRALEGTTITNVGGPMIEPFIDHLVRENGEGEKVISYGLTSYGYDVRIKDEVKLFTNVNNGVVDPMSPDERCFVDATIQIDEKGNRFFILPPNSYALAVTEEYFRIPENVMVVCVGKSTYARSAILINTTPIEAGFEGHIKLKLTNSSNSPYKVYTEMGVAHCMFFRGNVPCEIVN
jgi:dCTP deaminase